MTDHGDLTAARELAAQVERFVREVVIADETDRRHDTHGSLDALVQEMRGRGPAAESAARSKCGPGSETAITGRLTIPAAALKISPLAFGYGNESRR